MGRPPSRSRLRLLVLSRTFFTNCSVFLSYKSYKSVSSTYHRTGSSRVKKLLELALSCLAVARSPRLARKSICRSVLSSAYGPTISLNTHMTHVVASCSSNAGALTNQWLHYNAILISPRRQSRS
jgi:hypothetical protein